MHAAAADRIPAVARAAGGIKRADAAGGSSRPRFTAAGRGVSGLGGLDRDGAGAGDLGVRLTGKAGNRLGRAGADAGGGRAVLEAPGADWAVTGLRPGQNLFPMGRVNSPAGERAAGGVEAAGNRRRR